MRRWAVIVGLWLALAAPVLAQDHPLKGVALVIGESRYEGLLPALSNPRNDARAMDDLLSDLGFDVTRVLDGDKARLDGEIAGFEDAAQDADVALVYYAGHGIEAGGSDFLVPVDADLSTPQAAGAGLIAVDGLLQRLGKSVPVTIMLLDACRTNGLPAGTLVQPPGAETPLMATDAGLAVVRGPSPVLASVAPDQLGTVIGFAASPGQSALDGDADGNSPYAAALLKHLGAGGYSFGDLMTMVSEEVYLRTGARQLPWVNSSLRRVLSFGTPLPAGDADEAAIAQGRRQLLLSIAAAPAETRGTVEAVAKSAGVPLDALYGMLKVLGVDTSDPGRLQAQLQQGAEQLKTIMAQRPGAAKSDPELARLSKLADAAQAEGAIDLALKYREAASARADDLEAQVDANEASVRADRLQLAATYGEHAQTAMLNFDYAVAAQQYGKAYGQASNWDARAARSYRAGQAGALEALGTQRGDPQLIARAIDLYGAVIDGPGAGDDAVERAYDRNGRATAREHLNLFTPDVALLNAAAVDLQASLAVFTRAAHPSEWVMATSNLAAVEDDIADQAGDSAAARDAVALFRSLLAGKTRADDPDGWATLQYNIGTAFTRMGKTDNDLRELGQGTVALVAASRIWRPTRSGEKWRMTQYLLGANLAARGRVPEAANILKALLRRGGLTDVLRLQTLMALGQAKEEVAVAQQRPELLDEALASYRRAAAVPDPSRIWHASAQNRLGHLETQLGGQRNDPALLRQAIGHLQEAVTVRTRDNYFPAWVETSGNLGFATIELALLDRSVEEAAAGRDILLPVQQELASRGLPANATVNTGIDVAGKLIALLSQPPSP